MPVSKFKNLKFWRIFKICNFDFVIFWLGIQYDSMGWVIMRRRGVSSERRHSSCSSLDSSDWFKLPFCTCHDNLTALACAKLWYKWNIIVKAIQPHFHFQLINLNMRTMGHSWPWCITIFGSYMIVVFICNLCKPENIFHIYWPFVRGIHRWPVNSPHKGQWCKALICLNQWLSKQSWGWWFETPSCSLWLHYNFIAMYQFGSHNMFPYLGTCSWE